MVLGVGWLLFFVGLERRDLWSSHEARAGQNAQSILNAGRLTVPRLYDGQRELQKPPLYYWLAAGSAWLRGGEVTAWDVRLPAALSALLGVLALLLFGWHVGRPWLGFSAALALATMLHYAWMARVGRIDMPLSLAVTAALLGYYLSWRQASRGGVLLTYLGLALAVLLKGPIGLVLPGVAIVGHQTAELAAAAGSAWAWRDGVRRLKGVSLALLVGAPLVLAIVGPYFWWLHAETGGEFTRLFFWHHNLARGLGSAEELEVHPWWLYLARLGPDLFPWSLLLPLAFVYLWQGAWRDDPLVRFGCVWFGTMLLFLSAMSFKRADYLLPAYAGLALVLGGMATDWLGKRRPLGVAVALGCVVLLSVAGWWVQVQVILPKAEPAREQRTFAAEVRRRVPAGQPVLVFRAEAHLLGFHLGPPIDRLIEWENLDIWTSGVERIYVVMPAEYAAQWRDRLEAGQLFPIVANTDPLAGGSDAEPFVLMSNQPDGRTTGD